MYISYVAIYAHARGHPGRAGSAAAPQRPAAAQGRSRVRQPCLVFEHCNCHLFFMRGFNLDLFDRKSVFFGLERKPEVQERDVRSGAGRRDGVPAEIRKGGPLGIERVCPL